MIPSLERILFAEDEPDIQEVASLALETVGGFTLKVCNTGLEAVQTAAAFKPDLILLDVMMPVMDGPTALKELRKIPEVATTPAIFMTAKVHAQEVATYKAQGALTVIPKPFDPMELANTIQQAWAAHHQT